MAVYTHISEKELKDHLAQYALGALTAFEGITGGTHNTNYKIETTTGIYVLTVFEGDVLPEDLGFCLDFMTFLRARHLPVAAPVLSQDGDMWLLLRDKPALLTPFLKGQSPDIPNSAQCRAISHMLADMHIAAKGFGQTRQSAEVSFAFWREHVDACADKADKLEKGLYNFLSAELDNLEQNWPQDMPAGSIHGDVFPNNTMFEGDTLTGIFDFYFAATGEFVYDVMMTVNAWCFVDGEADPEKISVFLKTYHQYRPLTEVEIMHLPFFGRAAAMRFISMRLYDWFHQQENAQVNKLDPLELVRILRFHKDIATPGIYGLAA